MSLMQSYTLFATPCVHNAFVALKNFPRCVVMRNARPILILELYIYSVCWKQKIKIKKVISFSLTILLSPITDNTNIYNIVYIPNLLMWNRLYIYIFCVCLLQIMKHIPVYRSFCFLQYCFHEYIQGNILRFLIVSTFNGWLSSSKRLN